MRALLNGGTAKAATGRRSRLKILKPGPPSWNAPLRLQNRTDENRSGNTMRNIEGRLAMLEYALSNRHGIALDWLLCLVRTIQGE
jgi:hypothetical protein